MSLRIIPTSPTTRRPRCSAHDSCLSKRPRDSSSTTSSQQNFHSNPKSTVSLAMPSTPIHKRHRPSSTCNPQLSHYRGPGPPLHLLRSPSNSNSNSSSSSSSSSSTVTCSSIITSTCSNLPTNLTPTNHHIELPDEVLVAIFRFIDHASKLARLRTVCKQWCNVIDHTPDVWRIVSFKNSDFSQPVATSYLPNTPLKLAPRPGQKAVTTAARSGNEWARFLKKIVFDRQTLRAVTIPQPAASLLVSGERPLDARPFPPWHGELPDTDGTWVAIHAARRASHPLPNSQQNHVNNDPPLPANGSMQESPARTVLRGIDLAKLPFGAMVGMIHVCDAFQTTGPDNPTSAPKWIWRIDRAVRLKKPIRCAGFVGMWSISGFLTDLIVNAMHKQ